MTVAASLAFNQAGGAGASAPGFSLLATFAQLPHSVIAHNGDDTGVVQWTYEMTEVPAGSAVPTGVLQDGGTPTFSWLPDKAGGYRLHLTVKDADGNLAEDFRVFQVAEPSGNIVPPFGAKGSELNFTLPSAGSPNGRGWAPLQEVYDRAIDATYGTQTGTPTDGNFSESAAVVSRQRIQYAQALTADRTITYPTPASPALDYERTVLNATTGGHNLVLKCGAGATVTVPNGQQLVLWFKSTGDVVANTSGGGGSFTAGGDLTGTSSSQQVVSATGAGGVFLVACTDVAFGSGVTGPTITQAQAAGAVAGQPVTMIGQSGGATGTQAGGDAIVSGGLGSGGGAAGAFRAGSGATELLHLAAGSGDFISVGANAASAGGGRFGNGVVLKWRNHTNASDISALDVSNVTGLDTLEIGGSSGAGPGAVTIWANGAARALLGGYDAPLAAPGQDCVQFGSVPASKGYGRFTYGNGTDTGLRWRDKAGTGDVSALDVVTSGVDNVVQLGGTSHVGAISLTTAGGERVSIDDATTTMTTKVDVVWRTGSNSGGVTSRQPGDTSSAAAATLYTYAIPSGTSRVLTSTVGTKSDLTASYGAMMSMVVRNNAGTIGTDLAAATDKSWGSGTVTLTVSGTNLLLADTPPAGTWNRNSTIEAQVS